MPTLKERKWLEEYLRCWNATEAARRAGYKWPNKQGPVKLQKFKAEIAARLEKDAMSAAEVLERLAERARFDVSPYLVETADGVKLDLDQLIEDGHGRHVRTVTPTRYGDKVEFYDGQECLILMAKHHGLITDKREHSGKVEIEFGFAEEHPTG